MSAPRRPRRGAPLTYRIDPHAGIVEILGHDPATLRDFDNLLRAVFADPAYRRGMGFLRDRRGAPPPSVNFVRAAVLVLEGLPEVAGTCWAVVVDDTASLGMIRMAEIMARSTRIQPFQSLDEARAWLQSSRRPEPAAAPPRRPAAEPMSAPEPEDAPPLPYLIDPHSGIVEILGVESTDPAALGDTLAAILSDPAWRRDFGFLRDRSEAKAPPTAFITTAMRIINEIGDLAGSRWAIVVGDPASYGMARMASALATSAEVRVFRARAEAIEWLIESRPRN